MAGQADLSTCIQATVFFPLGVRLAPKNKNKKLYTTNRLDGQMALIAKPSLVPRSYGLGTRLGKPIMKPGDTQSGYEGAQGSEAQGIRWGIRRHRGYDGVSGGRFRTKVIGGLRDWRASCMIQGRLHDCVYIL